MNLASVLYSSVLENHDNINKDIGLTLGVNQLLIPAVVTQQRDNFISRKMTSVVLNTLLIATFKNLSGVCGQLVINSGAHISG